MRVLLVHPSALMYSEIFLRLEPLGLERVASALLADGHDVRLIDLQVYDQADLRRQVADFRPEAVGFGLNYLANVPEVVDLARWVKSVLPRCLVFCGGHSVSFVAEHVLAHAEGAIDVVLKGEGESAAPALLAAAPDRALTEVPGAVTTEGAGPPPRMVHSLDDHLPARHLGGRRGKYFIGVMDPAASIEFTRGCPWDCSFCSAWTFYGRSYRRLSPEAAAEDMARITEPGVFIVDDVAFIKAEEGDEIARQLERRGIRKQYYLETRCDVLIRNEEVFRRWRRLGLNYMFLGLEALDEEGLRQFRKRTTPKVNNQALEIARSMGLSVAINIIADPDWDESRFAFVREWAMSVPEIVNITVQTPYPGTETWLTESRRLTTLDYRLFDVQHAVLPTRLPLRRFYEELVKTQSVLARKHLGVAALAKTGGIIARQLLHGQTNFARMIWKFNDVYNADRQYSEHQQKATYLMPQPAPSQATPVTPANRKALYVHATAPTHKSLARLAGRAPGGALAGRPGPVAPVTSVCRRPLRTGRWAGHRRTAPAALQAQPQRPGSPRPRWRGTR
jgi:hopanoid C-3 methylase